LNTIYKWMGIVIAAGVVLMVVEYRFAKKKKEGFTATDKRRIFGIFWLTIFFSLLVGALIWLTPDD
jgi:multisubunit Na+/H+ antiporter MnhB subunit